jgi:hypothetical protein
MTLTRTRRILGVLLLLISLALLCWGLWPLARLSQSVPLRPTEMQLPPPGSFFPGLAGLFCG